MNPWLVLLTTLLLLPLLYVVAVTLGVWLNMRFARLCDRLGPGQDPYQERVFAPAEPARAPARLRGVLREGTWQSLAFALQARHFLRPFAFPAPVPGGGPVVVLVAGYVENGGTMWWLGRALLREGLQPVLVDLPSTLRSLDSNVAFVSDRVRSLGRELGGPIAYVGHSMGGVIGRALVRSRPDHGLSVVVTLASPHRGTHLARLGLGLSARDMSHGSEFMARHTPEERGAPGVAVHTLITAHDNIVSPPWSTVLGPGEGEDVLYEEPLGHTGILYQERVVQQVAAWVRAAARVQAARAQPTQPPSFASSQSAHASANQGA
ncbi:MAG: esterase/lipase family protein [Planctomycetota bacterium]